MQVMWEHALGNKICQCLPVGVCYLPLCLVLGASSWLFDFVSYFLARYKNENNNFNISHFVNDCGFL
jgi:hypothetical protein